MLLDGFHRARGLYLSKCACIDTPGPRRGGGRHCGDRIVVLPYAPRSTVLLHLRALQVQLAKPHPRLAITGRGAHGPQGLHVQLPRPRRPWRRSGDRVEVPLHSLGRDRLQRLRVQVPRPGAGARARGGVVVPRDGVIELGRPRIELPRPHCARRNSGDRVAVLRELALAQELEAVRVEPARPAGAKLPCTRRVAVLFGDLVHTLPPRGGRAQPRAKPAGGGGGGGPRLGLGAASASLAFEQLGPLRVQLAAPPCPERGGVGGGRAVLQRLAREDLNASGVQVAGPGHGSTSSPCGNAPRLGRDRDCLAHCTSLASAS
mmetsp:Transcript_117582/g.310573  ORF Transcript_117582/g.310573 Transcript_117582/m.310573 type:complete len:318 (+) Transcript_117582:1117-2070(+)